MDRGCYKDRSKTVQSKLRRVFPCWKFIVRDKEIDDRLDIFKISVSVYRVYAVGREETVIWMVLHDLWTLLGTKFGGIRWMSVDWTR